MAVNWDQGPLLQTWFNFNHSMDKNGFHFNVYGMKLLVQSQTCISNYIPYVVYVDAIT